VLVTTSNKHEAEKIAQSLLEEQMVACANIWGPIASHYRWEGRVEHAEEFLVLLKSRRDLFDLLTQKVKAMHSYELPEIIAVPIIKGSNEYLNWLYNSIK
jgi:periplasmic divalent cation tolerance protein